MKLVVAALLLLSLILVISACGEGSSAEPTLIPSPTASATAEPSASPTPTPTPTSPEQGVVYIVKLGDTLESIAVKFDTTVEAIATANDIEDPDLIVVGQQLAIPHSER